MSLQFISDGMVSIYLKDNQLNIFILWKIPNSSCRELKTLQ
jgi:hypothetical protein